MCEILNSLTEFMADLLVMVSSKWVLQKSLSHLKLVCSLFNPKPRPQKRACVVQGARIAVPIVPFRATISESFPEGNRTLRFLIEVRGVPSHPWLVICCYAFAA